MTEKQDCAHAEVHARKRPGVFDFVLNSEGGILYVAIGLAVHVTALLMLGLHFTKGGPPWLVIVGFGSAALAWWVLFVAGPHLLDRVFLGRSAQ